MLEPSVGYAPLMEAAGIALAAGDRAKAEASLRAAIESIESRLDARDELTFALVKLGSLKQEAGNYAESGEIFARALEVCERAHGPTDVAVVPALTGVGTSLILRGRAAVAQPLLARALNISETQLGEGHPDLVILLNDLSRLYMKQSAYAFAEPLLTRLLAIKRAKGEDHPEVATVLASLGVLQQALGRYETAEQTWLRVVAIRERTLAPNHFSIATALEHLAQTLAARGRNREALNCYQRAYTIRELGLGAGHASLHALRERIADLQLQAAEDSMDEGPTLLLTTSAPRPSTELQPALRFAIESSLQPPQRKTVFATVAAFVIRRRIAASIVLGILALPLLAWGVAGFTRNPSRGSVTQVALAQSVPRRDSLRFGGAPVDRLRRTDTMRIENSSPLNRRTLPPLFISESSGRSRLADEPSASRPIPVPTMAQAAISQQGLSRIDSAIRAGEGPRVLGSESLRQEFLTGDDKSPPSKSGPDITLRARLIGEMPVPVYPPMLRAIGVKGRVIVRFDVDTAGRPIMRSFTVVESPHAALTEAVRKVIPEMRFEPAQSGLASTPTTDNVEMRFSFTRP